jgi:hypothetical protein
LGNPVIAPIYEIITEPLTALVLLNSKHKRQNIDSKITDVAPCKVIKQVFLNVNKLILIKYNYQSAKSEGLYLPAEGPAGQRAYYPPNSGWLRYVHRTVPELTVQVNLQSGLRIW